MNHSEENTLDIYKARKMPEEYKPFPVGMLPDPVGKYITEAAEALGCDAAYVVLPMLSALASAIGNSRRIGLKGSWDEPAILWTGIIGESGSMKTPAMKKAMAPLKKLQNEAFKDHAERMDVYNSELQEYENTMKTRSRKDPVPEKPVEPDAVRYCCSDVTIEALAGLLSKNPRGLLLCRDELSGWLNSFNAYKKNGSDESQWLELYQGGTLTVDRKTGVKTLHIENASVSLCGGIQPGILRQSLGRKHYDSGLAARILMAMPPREVNFWKDADIDSELVGEIEGLFRELLKFQMDDDGCGGFTPKVLPLETDAQVLWITFHDEHAKEMAEMTGDLAAVWSKLKAVAARIALVVHSVRVAAGDVTLAHDGHIDEDSVYAGITLSRWFGAEIRRVYAVLEEGEYESQQRHLYELVLKKGGRMTVRQLMQASRKYRGSTEEAKAALQGLVNIGWCEWKDLPPGQQGGQPVRMAVIKETGGNTTPSG